MTFQSSFSEIGITGCTVSLNTGDGISVGIGAGSGCTITGCTVSSNTGNGIIGSDGCTITGCTIRRNTLNGIRIGGNSRVIDNNCDTNGIGAGLFSGIYTNASGSRIEGNSVTGNDFGIFLDGPVAGNLVIRNHARGNTTNYTFPASGNFIGTQIGTSGAMNAATNSLINISN